MRSDKSQLGKRLILNLLINLSPQKTENKFFERPRDKNKQNK